MAFEAIGSRYSMTTATRTKGSGGDIVIDEFVRDLNKIQQVLGVKSIVAVAAGRPSTNLLQKCVDAPVPIDTGKLSRSGKVEKGKRSVTIGFDTHYAGIQDWGGLVGMGKREGTRMLVPNEPGIARGPNYYFTSTLQKEANNFFQDLIDDLTEAFVKAKAVVKKGRTTRGGRSQLFLLKLPIIRSFAASQGRSVHFRRGGSPVVTGHQAKAGHSGTQYIGRAVGR